MPLPDLIPVDHDPFARRLVAVDHDPFDPLAASAGIAPAGTPRIDQINFGQPSWLQQASEQSQRDRAAFAQGGVRGMLRDTEGTQDLTGGFSDAPLGLGIKAFHGSPHDFERFDLSKIGTGEGAQAYGQGLYFAEHEGTAKSYRDVLGRDRPREIEGTDLTLPSWVANSIEHGERAGVRSRADTVAFHRQDFENRLRAEQEDLQTSNQPWNVESRISNVKNVLSALDALDSGKRLSPPGRMYEVSINADPEHFLDWDKPLSEQYPTVKKALEPFRQRTVEDWSTNPTLGEPTHVGQVIANHSMSGKGAELTEALRSAGIPGIKYLDQGSRGVRTPAEATAALKSAREELAANPDSQQLQIMVKQLEKQAAAPEPTSNYVVFDDKLIDIIKKYGLAGLIAGGAAHFSTRQVDHDPFAQ